MSRLVRMFCVLVLGVVVACAGSNQSSETDGATLPLGEQAAAAYESAMAECLLRAGFESVEPLQSNTGAVEARESSADFGLGISTRYFNQDALPTGLLGRSMPAPVPTPENGRFEDMTVAERAALTAVMDGPNGCEALARSAAESMLGAAANAIGSFEPGDSGADLDALLLADPEVAQFRTSASRCVRDKGHSFADPDSAREFFRSAVEAIGPETAIDLSSNQLDRLAQVQSQEIAASADLSACGWFDEYSVLIERVVGANRE